MARQKNPKSKQPAQPDLDRDIRAVSKYLAEVKFRKRLLGVDEADVWRKVEKLCDLYEFALETERARADEAQKKLNDIYARLRAANAARNAASHREDLNG